MPAKIKTRLTEMLGIDYPILLGGMAWVGSPKLAAAVTNAGGLGIIGAATMSAEEFSKSIDAIRKLTDGPFGINISLVVRNAEELVQVAMDKKVPVAQISGGSPSRVTARLKDAGMTVIHVVPSCRLAEKASLAGVDAVVGEGTEAGGHLGYEEIPMATLVPLMRSKVNVPVVAAGGIVCGGGFVAAMALGAAGIQIGTLFAAAEESPAHAVYKKMVIEATEKDPVIYGRLEFPARALATPAIKHLVHLDRTGASPEEIDKARSLGRGHLGMLDGDVEKGVWGREAEGQRG